jgi:hypothetical protein
VSPRADGPVSSFLNTATANENHCYNPGHIRGDAHRPDSGNHTNFKEIH